MLYPILLLLIPIILTATEQEPWYPRYLELQPKATYIHQTYPSLAAKHGHKKQRAHDHFLFLSVSGAYDPYSVEVETALAATRHRSFGWAALRLTGRYQLFNDTVGDLVSVVAGLTVEQVFKQALRDVANFYHGGIQGEAHLSIGKETECWKFWTSRLWGVGAVGIADLGSPWLRFDLGWSHNFWDQGQVKFYMHSLWGLGGKSLHPRHFHGYGSIRHQSIDIGLEGKHRFAWGGILGLGYGYRVLAANCPKDTSFILLSFLYPFGL